MSVLIRDIDKKIYAKFKAKAAELGLKIGEALTKAMEEWIDDNKPLDENEFKRKINLAAYRTIISDLEKNYPNKWALIAKGELKCIKETREEIINEMKKRNLIGEPCYTFQIGKKIKKRTFGLGSKRK